MREIKTIEDLIKMLQEIRDFKGDWTSKITIFADGSARIEQSNGEPIEHIRRIQNLKFEKISTPRLIFSE